jgi:multidrug efflux system membrane fusion protein
VVDDDLVELGDFVGIGDPVARVIDLDPIVVTAQVSQQQIGELTIGDEASARLLTGQTVEGVVRYIGSMSNEATRTFKIEVEVANPDHAIAAGVTARLSIPTRTVQAHLLSPELLSLGEDGELGIKTVGNDNRVEFHPVSIVQASPEGVWFTGLPDTSRIITVGQGFVQAGQNVRPIPEEDIAVNPSNGKDRS